MKKLIFTTIILSGLFFACKRDHVIIDPIDPPVETSWKACPGLDSIKFEGRIYHTVLIGDQCWLQENMNTGILIQNIENPTNNGLVEKFCFNNDTSYCNRYGGLYTWGEAMKYSEIEYSQGICPPGFHIPTDGEYKILEGNADSQFDIGDEEWEKLNTFRGFDAGGNLKTKGTVDWNYPNEGATNSTGFSALPHGYRTFDNYNFASITGYMCMWTSSKYSPLTSYRRAIGDQTKNIHRSHHNIYYGYSIRCIKD